MPVPYRENEPRSFDIEIAATHELLSRMRRLRRRVALPILVLSLVASWLGAVAHAIGHWSILGTLSDGSYFVNAATLLLAATLAGAPVLGPGVCLYLALRGRLRSAWRTEYRNQGLSNRWLRPASRRFG